MIDLIGVLRPASGVVRGHVLLPPSDMPLWLLGVDVGLGAARERVGATTTPYDLVGAYGWSRADALTRAAGEAVERFALLPPEGDDPLLLEEVCAREAAADLIDLVGAALLGPDVDPARLRFVTALEPAPGGTGTPGAERLPGAPRLLPAELVTDPLPERPWSDGSPSGAAAGPDWRFAAERALLECVERDAALCCWALRPRVPFFDALELARYLGAVPGDRLDAVERYLDRHGSRVRTALLPTDVPGVHVALTSMAGREGDVPVLATGARAGASLAECVAASLREAVQVHSALLPLLALPSRPPPETPVVDEVTRAWACLAPAMTDHHQQWLAHAGLLDPSASTLPPERPRPALEELVAALTHRGLRPVLADLTPRLPAPVRTAGWSVVRAVVLGHQPYRMDDTKDWSWNHARLDDWRSRLDHPVAADPSRVGHPLI